MSIFEEGAVAAKDEYLRRISLDSAKLDMLAQQAQLGAQASVLNGGYGGLINNPSVVANNGPYITSTANAQIHPRGWMGNFTVTEINNGYLLVTSPGEQHYCENLQDVGTTVAALLVATKAQRGSE